MYFDKTFVQYIQYILLLTNSKLVQIFNIFLDIQHLVLEIFPQNKQHSLQML